MKKCPICNKKLNKINKSGFCGKHFHLSPKGKEIAKIYRKKYRQLKKVKIARSDYRLKYAYGISLDDKKNSIEDQNNKCAICCNFINVDTGFVDHDHETGELRGILCMSCNCGIGFFYENVEFIKAAIKYIKNN